MRRNGYENFKLDVGIDRDSEQVIRWERVFYYLLAHSIYIEVKYLHMII